MYHITKPTLKINSIKVQRQNLEVKDTQIKPIKKDKSIINSIENHVSAALVSLEFTWDSAINICMETDRLCEEISYKEVKKNAEKIYKGLYKIDKKIVDKAKDYVAVSLLNLGFSNNIIANVLMKLDENFMYYDKEKAEKISQEIFDIQMLPKEFYEQLKEEGYIN